MFHRFSWFSGMSRLACKLSNILPGFLRLVLGPHSNQASFLDPLGFLALIFSQARLHSSVSPFWLPLHMPQRSASPSWPLLCSYLVKEFPLLFYPSPLAVSATGPVDSWGYWKAGGVLIPLAEIWVPAGESETVTSDLSLIKCNFQTRLGLASLALFSFVNS